MSTATQQVGLSDWAQLPVISPWGEIHTRKKIAEGVWFVSTRSHGGMWLAPWRAALVPDEVKRANWLGSSVWWEEDSDVGLVSLMFEDVAPEIRERSRELFAGMVRTFERCCEEEKAGRLKAAIRAADALRERASRS